MGSLNLNKSIAIFENDPVRRIWLENDEKWVFSVVDIIRVLTESKNANTYWRVLKNRLKAEGNQSVTNCNALKFLSNDGKYYLSDATDVETIFRLIQSIPSPKAEPFKLWLARVGYERLKETVDPELAVNRARGHWQTLGRSKPWIEQRMRGQETRNKLTDYWSDHKVSKEKEFAILTNIIHQEWTGLSVSQHKKLKSLKGHNLRDNMTEAELLFTSLAELSTRQIAEKDLAIGFKDNAVSAKKGGSVASRAKQDLERLTGNKVVSKNNFLAPRKKQN